MPIRHSTDTPTSTKPRQTRTTQHQPRQVQTAIPTCAQSCLSSQIAKFTCAKNDLSCLCSKYSSDGFTFGELAFVCLQEHCTDITSSQEINAFNVCAGKPKAVSATHSILTISTAVTSVTSGGAGTSLLTATATSTPAVAQSYQGATTTSEPTTSAYAPTATVESSASSRNGTASGSNLSTAQAVGVSVASIGGMVLAMALVYLFTCMRRRKLQKQQENRDSYDFVDEAPPRFSPFNFGRYNKKVPFGDYAVARVELPSEKHSTMCPSQDQLKEQPPPESYHGHEKSIDTNPNDLYGSSPESHISNSSQRTTSQLLPDKPERTLLRPFAKSPYRGALATPATVFEEEGAVPKMSGALPGFGLPGKAVKLKNSQSFRQPQYAPEYTRSPEPIKQPSLSIEIPKRPPRSDSIQVVNAPPPLAIKPNQGQPGPEVENRKPLSSFPIPPPPPPLRIRTRSGEYPPRTSVHSKLSRSSRPESNGNSLLDYYTGADASSHGSTTPIEEAQAPPLPRPAAITITKPTYPPRGSRLSDASHRTSFESTDPEEPTPPEDLERQLTPVRSSPMETSPIADIRYPKVPRSSAQVVPRKNQYPVPTTPERPAYGQVRTLSKSTLAAKRRGDSAAHDLEKGLRIKDSSHSRSNSSEEAKARVQSRQNQRHESPLRGYGRDVTDWPLPGPKQPAAERPVARKSDYWEPKLTPKRDGDDLYLSVSVATPKYSTFGGRR